MIVLVGSQKNFYDLLPAILHKPYAVVKFLLIWFGFQTKGTLIVPDHLDFV